jgi:hypothetical protein
MTFAVRSDVAPPAVEDGSLPKPGEDQSDAAVVLEFVVDRKGSVRNVHSVYGSEAAAELLGRSLLGWKFRPAVDGGNLVEATGRVKFIRGKGDEATNRDLFAIEAFSTKASIPPTSTTVL